MNTLAMPAKPPAHFFESSSDGALYDTRRADWSSHPLRLNYCQHHREIRTVADLKATLRAGEFTFPGCYQLYFITSDGEALSFVAARSEFRLLCAALREGDTRSGWHVCACEVNYEDAELYCAHTGKLIPAAYV